MIQRSKPIRRTAVKKKRTKPRRGQPTPAEKKALRDQVYAESGGRCEIHKHPLCSGYRILPSEGNIFKRWHLVHLKAKRVHGWARENLCGGCWYCHLISLHNPKPCPPKPHG